MTLFTDLPAAPEVDELPAVFDLAVPQWCEFFGVPPAEAAPWQVVGYLIADKQRFQDAGLWPAEIPRFLHGYARDHELWIKEQPSAYFRRHLLLHEGTHGFMLAALGGCGPPWYMEGIAELLATHRWHEGTLQLAHFPQRREDVPYWGRIRTIREAQRVDRALSLADVFSLHEQSFLDTAPYAWSWAAAAWLDGHPRWHHPFRQLIQQVRGSSFATTLEQLVDDQRSELQADWQLFVENVDYGYEFSRTVIDYTRGRPLEPPQVRVTVAADRQWQNSGLWVEAGKRYQLQAFGRFQIAQTDRPWISEPDGISIRYHRGRPLGQLLGRIYVPAPHLPRADTLTETHAALAAGWLPDWVVGSGTLFTPAASGTLFFQVNDAASERADNAGSLEIELQPLAKTDD